MVFQVIEVRWQLFLQRATHVVLLAGWPIAGLSIRLRKIVSVARGAIS